MAKNVVIRRPNPGLGQGRDQAISARTGWAYEHDETDEQIDAIEEIIATHREQSGRETDAFSWNVDEDGNVLLQVTYPEGKPSERKWATLSWKLSPAGKAIED